MNRETSFGIMGGVIFLLVGAFLGFLVGTYIGGNYFPDFTLWTWRGYEATGWIGILAGGILGAIFGVVAGRWAARRRPV